MIPEIPERIDLSKPRLRLPPATTLKAALEVLQPALLLLGLALYGAGRIETETFYGQLGTSPEEVGLSYVTAVTRTAIGVLSAGLVIVLYVAVILRMSAWTRRRRLGATANLPPPPSSITTEVVKFITGLLFVAVYYVWGLIDRTAPVMVVAALLLAALALWSWYRWPRDRLTPYRVALSLALALAGIIGSGLAAGRWNAEEVMEGRETHPNPVFGIVPLDSSCVNVVWLDGEPPTALSIDKRMMYLGQANSTLILYQSAPPTNATVDGTLVRLPTADVALIDRDCP